MKYFYFSLFQVIKYNSSREASWSSVESGSITVQKVAVRSRVRGFISPCDDWKTLSVNAAVNGYLFRIREGQRDWLRLSSAVPKIQ